MCSIIKMQAQWHTKINQNYFFDVNLSSLLFFTFLCTAIIQLKLKYFTRPSSR